MQDFYNKDLSLAQLPSKASDSFTAIIDGFMARESYISTWGFMLFSKEFATELITKLEDILPRDYTAVEIEAGVGTFTKLFLDNDIKCTGYTLPVTEKKNWGLIPTQQYSDLVESGDLIIHNIIDLKLDKKPDIVIVSWIPYRGGHEVIKFWENNAAADKLPEWFLIVGEDLGGCTSSDKFFKWLDDNFIEEWTSTEYTSFSGIHDRVILYKKL